MGSKKQCKKQHFEYAMEANAPTLRANISQLKRAQRLAKRILRGFHRVPYEKSLRQLNLFSLELRCRRADLILAFKLFTGEIGLSPFDFFLRPPRAGLRGHLQITARTKPSSTKKLCISYVCRELLEQIVGASSHVTLRVCH